ncbi:MAG: hypothetical protein QXG05_07635 [Nitrososphaerota archaeon]
MNKTNLVIVVISAALCYIALIISPYAWGGLIASLPLFIIKPARAFVAGFSVGLATSISLFIAYPMASLLSLASLIGRIINLSPYIVIVIYPLFFAIIVGLSASLWSTIYRIFRPVGG